MTGPLLAAGPEAGVYALDERRVLRRYRRDADVAGEAGALRCLAGLLRRPHDLPPWPGAADPDTAAERVRACAR